MVQQLQGTENRSPVQKVSVTQVRQGSTVALRIVQQNGKDVYQGMVQGVPVSIHSAGPLEKGAVYKAVVSGERNGQILLTLARNETAQAVPESSLQLISLAEQGQTLSSEAAQYLQNLGLAPDLLNAQAVTFLKQNGLSLDKNRLDKVRILSKTFPGKEKEAIQAALLLEEKGIPATHEKVQRFLNALLIQESEEKNEPLLQEKKSEKKAHSRTEEIPADFNGFCETAAEQEPGLLTLINHRTFNRQGSGNEHHWFYLPLCWGPEQQPAAAAFLLNTRTKSTEQIALKISTSLYLWRFMLYYEGKSLERLTVRTEPAFSAEMQQRLSQKLARQFSEENGKKVSVDWNSDLTDDFLWMKDSSLEMLEGML